MSATQLKIFLEVCTLITSSCIAQEEYSAVGIVGQEGSGG